MLATPRLPAVIPTRIPGLIPCHQGLHLGPGLSGNVLQHGASNRCRTRTIRDGGASQCRSAT